jgi:hypothetical protein
VMLERDEDKPLSGDIISVSIKKHNDQKI